MRLDEVRCILANLRDRFELAGDGHRRLSGVLTAREVAAFDIAIAHLNPQPEPSPLPETSQPDSQFPSTVEQALDELAGDDDYAADGSPVAGKKPGAPRDPNSALSKARHIYARMVGNARRREIVHAVVAATGVSLPVANTYIYSITRAHRLATRKQLDTEAAS